MLELTDTTVKLVLGLCDHDTVKVLTVVCRRLRNLAQLQLFSNLVVFDIGASGSQDCKLHMSQLDCL